MKTPAIITKVLTDYFRWLAGAVAIVVLIIGYLLLIAPKLSQVQSSEVARQKAAEQELKTKQDYITALKESNAKFAVTLPADRRQVIDDFMPSEADFPGLLLTVKNIVAQSNLTLSSITVGQGGQVAVAAGAATRPTVAATDSSAPSAQAATVGGINVKTQDITMSVTGGTSYDAFKNLLANIESSRRLFDVVSVSFSTALPDAKSKNATASSAWSLVLRSYYLPSK